MPLPTPAIPLMPADELARAVIDLLRADAVLGGFLFPSWSPSAGALDLRVYSASAELPQDVAIRGALPRIVIETTQSAFPIEQLEAGPRQADVSLYTHVFVPRQAEEHGKTIDSYLAALLVSTRLSTVRIITASLSYDGLRRVGRASGFDDAWEIVSQYRSPHVGVIA